MRFLRIKLQPFLSYSGLVYNCMQLIQERSQPQRPKSAARKSKKSKSRPRPDQFYDDDDDDYPEEQQDQPSVQAAPPVAPVPQASAQMPQIKLTPKNIFKLLILTFLLVLILWFFLATFEVVILRAKSMTKIKSDKKMQQFSGLDEQGYRSYYFFQEMEGMARGNVQLNKTIDYALVNNRFGDISFKELFGLFKVLKAIQYAKGYTPLPSFQQPSQPVEEYPSQLLSFPSNYTDFFLTAANQYQCASCYSFPITATIQYIYRRYFNLSIKLSQQQLIDCSNGDELLDGCTSGNITKGFQYAVNIGLVRQEDYPYRSKTGHSYPCRKDIVGNQNIRKYKIDGFRELPQGNCQAIQYQLYQGNTVATMMSVGELNSITQTTAEKGFRNCPKEPFNHAITIVGQTDKKQWIVRNSWGSSFGKNGYFVMKGSNTCGVCQHAIVPYFKDVPPINSNRTQEIVEEGGKGEAIIDDEDEQDDI